jgi:hypothetical protein
VGKLMAAGMTAAGSRQTTADAQASAITSPIKRMVAVYRKAATARLDGFIGPKG